MTPHNKNKVTSILILERALRSGRTPESLGCQPIGSGVSKTAYMWDSGNRKYVVKLDLAEGFRNAPKSKVPNLTKYGVKRIYHTRAGQYCIQELTTVLRTIKGDHPAWSIFNKVERLQGDYHSNNFGVRENGDLVCFDW